MKIQLNGMPFSPSGYGEVTRYYMHVLHKMGHNVRAHQPWEYHDAASPQMFGRVVCDEIEDLTGRHTDPDVVIDCAFQQMSLPRSSAVRLGHAVFETDPLPKAYAKVCDGMDAVITTGPWNKSLFERSGVKIPVYVVQPGVRELPAEAKSNDDEVYKFLSVFAWRDVRKNPLALLTAYMTEFERGEPVELLLRTGEGARTLVQQLKETLGKKEYPVVRVISETLTSEMMGCMYQQASCGVSASRAEGFCVPLLEAQAHGLPVITTNYSEPTSFVTEQTGYLVDWTREQAIGMRQGMPNLLGYWDESMTWAEINVSDLRRVMRHVFEHQDEARAKGAAGRLNVIENFSPKAAAAAFQKIFEERL